MTKKLSVGVKAAWITGSAIIFAAIIGTVVSLVHKQPPTVSQSATNSPGAIQAGRDVIINEEKKPLEDVRVTITPGESINEKNPFRTKFVIDNNSAYAVTNVTCLFLTTPNIPTAGEISTPTNHQLSPFKVYRWNAGGLTLPDGIAAYAEYTVTPQFFSGFTILNSSTRPPADNTPLDTNSILLQIACSFESGYHPGQRDTLFFRFYAVPDISGDWRWFPLGAGSPWVTNMPNLPPESY